MEDGRKVSGGNSFVRKRRKIKRSRKWREKMTKWKKVEKGNDLQFNLYYLIHHLRPTP